MNISDLKEGVINSHRLRICHLGITSCMHSRSFHRVPFFPLTKFVCSGMSVMESVARGTEGDDLPLVFKIPALFPSTDNRCSAREVAGLLGFGDVVLPAILGESRVITFHDSLS